MSAGEVLSRAHYRIVGSTDARVDPGDVLADALKAAGYAVVELPEAEVVDVYMGAGTKWWEYPDGEIYVHPDGDFEWRSYGINHDDPSRLRDAAAALLAAADAAEATS